MAAALCRAAPGAASCAWWRAAAAAPALNRMSLVTASSPCVRLFATQAVEVTSSSSTPPAPAFTPSATPSTAAASTPRVKFKSAFKRASAVMADVRADAWRRMQRKLAATRPLPDFNVGDAVEIIYASESSESSPVPVRGTVIAQRNKGLDSNFSIINAWNDEWYSATYPLSSPLLRSVKVMMRNRHSEGTKRPRRAKLTYLFKKDPKVYLVDQNTKEASEKAAERAERMALQRAGKVYKKTRAAPPVGPGGLAAKAAEKAAAGGKPAAGAAAAKKPAAGKK